MIRIRSALAAVLISLSAVQYAQADGITNGRFETGDFSGWTLGGNDVFPGGDFSAYHTITGTGFGLGPIQGTSSALVVSRASTGGLPCSIPISACLATSLCSRPGATDGQATPEPVT